jgi:flagellar hook-basal body complex protein FliE
VIPPVASAAAALPALPTAPTAPSVGAGGGGSFAQQIGGALDSLQATQSAADQLARQAAVGALQDPSEYMIAATQASLATELTVAVRNKAVEAFNSIMTMGV